MYSYIFVFIFGYSNQTKTQNKTFSSSLGKICQSTVNKNPINSFQSPCMKEQYQKRFLSCFLDNPHRNPYDCASFKFHHIELGRVKNGAQSSLSGVVGV